MIVFGTIAVTRQNSDRSERWCQKSEVFVFETIVAIPVSCYAEGHLSIRCSHGQSNSSQLLEVRIGWSVFASAIASQPKRLMRDQLNI
jgi:hypothetical protein